ncbi:MAG: DUF1553 domain-containing protein [Bryobacteraceae bacterium]
MTGNQRHLLLGGVLYVAAIAVGAERQEASGENCTFRSDPDEYLSRAVRERREVFDRTAKFRTRTASAGAFAVAPDSIPKRNFIDVQIFDKLIQSKTPSAALATDEEFLRRVTLDLTGRIPSPDEIRAFLAEPAESRRRNAVDRLLYSAEFVDKWAMWMGDLLGNVVVTNNVNRGFPGRNAFADWIRGSLYEQKPLKDMVWEMIAARGNNYKNEEAAVNYIIGGRQTMGPNQDVYDYMTWQATEKFLGLSHYDCLLCHDGRGHLTDISLWGRQLTRLDAERMAAWLSRTNWTQIGDRNDPFFQAWIVSDRTTGNYTLNTTFGNRPNRVKVGTITALDPEYRDGTKPTSNEWRAQFADKIITDPLFAINFANRLWKAMFNYGLVEPVTSLDPARLDPDNPPPAPWALQASHPALLLQLATFLRENNYDLRRFLKVIVESSAYQLSSRYDGEWSVSMVPLFARHIPRRLEGEEIHDAIVKSTGVITNYPVQGWIDPTPWAMRMPDPQEPRSNVTSLNFMNTFLRGNRDTQSRSQAGSVVQQLFLMNDSFVTNKTKAASSPTLKAISQITSNDAVIDELFLLFLSRKPTEYERGESRAFLAKAANAATRNAYIEDLAWTLINKAEFIFSY